MTYWQTVGARLLPIAVTGFLVSVVFALLHETEKAKIVVMTIGTLISSLLLLLVVFAPMNPER